MLKLILGLLLCVTLTNMHNTINVRRRYKNNKIVVNQNTCMFIVRYYLSVFTAVVDAVRGPLGDPFDRTYRVTINEVFKVRG